jgi:hypothetical protein
LAHLEAESVKSKGEIPHEEQYSWLSQTLGWHVKYQDIKDWFVVNAAALASRNCPTNETDGNPDLEAREYKSPPRAGLLASVPWFPVDPDTVIPENVVKYFQSLSYNEGLEDAVDSNDEEAPPPKKQGCQSLSHGGRLGEAVGMGKGNTANKCNFQSFNGNEELGITAGPTEKRRLTQEEAMMRFCERYSIPPKPTPAPRGPTIPIVQKKGRPQKKSEVQEWLRKTQRLRGSRSTTSLTSQSLLPNPADEVRAAIERRIQFEEVGLGAIDEGRRF